MFSWCNGWKCLCHCGVDVMDYSNENYEVDFWQGVCIITDKNTNELHKIKFKGNKTSQQFHSCMNTHGLNKACQVFIKLAA